MLVSITNQIKKLRNSVAPLFRVENGIPKIHGTCSFIKYQNEYFILTAQHVLNGYENNLFLPIKIKSSKLLKPGGLSFTDPNNDIGIIMLNDSTVQNIKELYEFINIDSSSTLKESYNKFSFFGFPESKSRFSRYKDIINVKPFIYTTKLVEKEIFKKLEIDLVSRFGIYYQKDKVYNVIKKNYSTGPDLYGVSGCIVIQHDKNQMKTLGILTDWNQKNKKVLTGTKFKVIEKVLLSIILQK